MRHGGGDAIAESGKESGLPEMIGRGRAVGVRASGLPRGWWCVGAVLRRERDCIKMRVAAMGKMIMAAV